ncbi:MAG: hypothetical protein A2X86_10560 [Bdellovibrionales bacterium GWA2_49_15]|nr:MAG: hypothetical protein A2X86_10560 [Bdellovibrionales bacterium GWA2_49_15]
MSISKFLLKTAIVALIVGYSQVSWSLDLPEHGVFKSYENCLMSSQGDLWVRMLRNFFPDKGEVKLVEERAFFQGIDRPTIGRNHIDIKYRALFENDLLPSSVGLDFRYEPKDGSLKLSLRRHQTAQPIELQEIKIPFYKYDAENTELEVLNRFGEVHEHKIRLAKNAQSYSYENSAPVTFKNKKTERSLSDSAGNLFQFDRAKFLACIKGQATKSALAYSITEMDGHNENRAQYIRTLEREARTYQQFIQTPRDEYDWVPVQSSARSR